jgi:TonB family protein
MQTFLLAACAFSLSLVGFDLTVEAQDNSGGGIIQSSHASSQKKRPRARRRARTRGQVKRVNREVVDTNMTVPPGVGAVIGVQNVDPPGNNANDAGAGEQPPAPPKPPRRTAPISGGVLNGKAISLPRPPYPAIARSARASGTVIVQVTVDEEGRVISARAVSGHPLLQAAAVQAAYGARFSPTQLSGQPVKVTGTLSYHFSP